MVDRILIRLWEYSDHIIFHLVFFMPNSEELETRLETKLRRNYWITGLLQTKFRITELETKFRKISYSEEILELQTSYRPNSELQNYRPNSEEFTDQIQNCRITDQIQKNWLLRLRVTQKFCDCHCCLHFAFACNAESSVIAFLFVFFSFIFSLQCFQTNCQKLSVNFPEFVDLDTCG